MSSGRAQVGFACAALVGYVALLALIPRLVPIDVPETIVSAALDQGYNAPVAHIAALLWSVGVVLAALLYWRRLEPENWAPMAPQPCGRIVGWELALVFAVFFLAYFPWFVARQGPLLEDHGFILSMFRMACGQIPFRDFEFLYGPLMVQSLAAWGAIFGVSMTSYFGYLATQEAVQFTILAAVLQIAVPDRKQRILVFLILLPFLVNTLLGVNWSAGRRLVPVLAILLAAARPFDLRVNLVVGTAIGLHASYSHDYAAAGLVGIGAIYGVLLLGPHWRVALRSGPVVAVTALGVWAGTVALLTRGDWTPYFDAMRRVVGAMSQGHVSFAFYWTLNALALFVMLAIACVVTGAALPRFRRGAATGDLVMVGALAFALVTLKSGLTRADHWHLAAAFLGLFFAFLLPLPREAVRLTRPAERLAFLAILVAALTFIVGIYPTGRYYAGAYYRGARDVLTGVPRTEVTQEAFRDLSTEPDRTHAIGPIVAIGEYLARPENSDRPVLYYGTSWMVAPRIGACPGDYKLDALMYSGFEITEAGFLEDHPDAFVVMGKSDYERIFGLSEQAPTDSLSFVERLASWAATVHYTQVGLEARLLDEARDSVSAAHIRRYFRPVDWPEPFSFEVLLERKD